MTQLFVSAPEASRTELRNAFGTFPSGVTAVCALLDGQPVGMAVSSFAPVSLEPPMVSFCVAHDSSTWPALRSAPVLGISVLAEGHAELCRAMAAKDTDRFAGVNWTVHGRNAVFIRGTPLQIEATVSTSVAAGDHDVVILQIARFRVELGVAPLLFHRSLLHAMPAGLV